MTKEAKGAGEVVKESAPEAVSYVLGKLKEKHYIQDCLREELKMNIADYKGIWEGIMKILSDIFNKELPFRPTADKERCAACPYAGLCK